MQPGMVLGGRYCAVRKIGQGGMGSVYLVYDERLEKYWAIKEIKKTSGEEFRERNVLKNLEHKGLARIVDILEDREFVYLVMDYILGMTLAETISQTDRISDRQVLLWGIELCEVISYLHEQRPSILYRDLKPSNIIVKKDGTLKLVDFGIAKAQTEKTEVFVDFCGTKGYAAPEQYQGRSDKRSDIYSLGAVLLAIAQKRKIPLMGKPRRIIKKCMQEIPSKRYASVSELKKELESALFVLHRKLCIRYAGLCCFLAGAVLFGSSLNHMKRSQKEEQELQRRESFIESRPRSAYEELTELTGNFSEGIDWTRVCISIKEARKEANVLPESSRKLEELLWLANICLTYEKELHAAGMDGWEMGVELLQLGQEVSLACPGERMALAYKTEFLLCLQKAYERSGDEERARLCYEEALEAGENFMKNLERRE